MAVLVPIGWGIMIVGLVMLLIAALCRMAYKNAFAQPMVHDGIGGKDTDNLFSGCVGFILSFVFLYVGGFVAVVGACISLIAYILTR